MPENGDILHGGGVDWPSRKAADLAQFEREDFDRAVALLKKRGYRVVQLKLALTGGLYLIEEEL